MLQHLVIRSYVYKEGQGFHWPRYLKYSHIKIIKMNYNLRGADGSRNIQKKLFFCYLFLSTYLFVISSLSLKSGVFHCSSYFCGKLTRMWKFGHLSKNPGILFKPDQKMRAKDSDKKRFKKITPDAKEALENKLFPSYSKVNLALNQILISLINLDILLPSLNLCSGPKHAMRFPCSMHLSTPGQLTHCFFSSTQASGDRPSVTLSA